MVVSTGKVIKVALCLKLLVTTQQRKQRNIQWSECAKCLFRCNCRLMSHSAPVTRRESLEEVSNLRVDVY
jgi:hypothetical protein